jgi:hypothetical protein
MKASTPRPEALHLLDEPVLHRRLEGAAGLLHDGAALQLDHRLPDVGVDPAKHAGEKVVTEHQGLRAHRRTVVVALVQGNHRGGHR